MGLSIAISGGIVTFTIVYAMMSFPAILDDTAKISRSSSEMSNTLDEIIHTNISISNVIDTAATATATFSITNTGNTILWNYQQFDAIASYPPPLPGNRVTSVLQYSSSCVGLTAGQWCINSITNDLNHPGLLDPGETANIKMILSNQAITSGGTFTINFGTDNGVIDTSSVTII
ncbi:MAG: hypothetical protein KGI09_00010 [Thaumarchaeota archaeon]|nr:hypothetical protein [Nitrososphaerota archaeon]